MPHPTPIQQEVIDEFRSQDWLIDRMQISGYRSSRRGVCVGVAHMAKHAVLSKHATKFFNRLDKIKEIPLEAFSESGKVNKFFKTEVHPLFNGIELYQNAQLYSDYFYEMPLYGDDIDDRVCAIIRPSILEEIVKPVDIGGMYTKQELISFFDMLQTAFENANCKHPAALLLTNVEHCVTVGYNPDKKKSRWQLFDANQLSNKKYKTSQKIANEVFDIFPDSGYAVFSTQIYVEAKASPSISESYLSLLKQEKWKNIHDFKEKLKFNWINYGRILAWAIMCRSDFIIPILEMIASIEDKERLGHILTTRFRNELTLLLGVAFFHPWAGPILLALISSLDNKDVIAIILGAMTIEGCTALNIAVCLQPQLVEPLLNCISQLENDMRATILIHSFECGSNVLIGAIQFQPSCAGVLLDAIFSLENKDAIDCILRKSDDTGRDSLIYAIAGGHISIVEKLLTRINTDALFENNSLIMFVAALYGSLSIVKLLLAAGLDGDCLFDISLMYQPKLKWILEALEKQTHKSPPQQPKEKKFIFPYQLARALGHEEVSNVLRPILLQPPPQVTDWDDMPSSKRRALECSGFFKPEPDKAPPLQNVPAGYSA